MANPRRGEIAVTLAGRPRTLCLTLGALAELEAAYQADGLAALAARLTEGQLSARDIQRLIAAGLAGAGEAADADEMAALGRDETITELAAIAGGLLAVTFGASAPS